MPEEKSKVLVKGIIKNVCDLYQDVVVSLNNDISKELIKKMENYLSLIYYLYIVKWKFFEEKEFFQEIKIDKFYNDYQEYCRKTKLTIIEEDIVEFLATLIEISKDLKPEFSHKIVIVLEGLYE